MNELYDKLIIRIFFTLFICFLLFVYKYAHGLLYPSARQQIFKRFYPSKNSADTIHLFSRIIGIGIIFSQLTFDLSGGISQALFVFLLEGVMIFLLYLASLYIMESIVLYNFEYSDEILKRKNYSYALICFSQATAIAYLLKSLLAAAQGSLIMILFLWLFSLVLLGFASKTFSTLSKLSFNRLLVQKNIGVSISYMGFLWGWTLIIASSLQHESTSIYWYSVKIILTIILSLIIFPLFRKGLLWVFNLQEDYQPQNADQNKDGGMAELGQGVFEGCLFLTSCFLTMVITGQIQFGNFYPVF